MPSNFKEKTIAEKIFPVMWKEVQISGSEISRNFLPMSFLFKLLPSSDIFSLSKSRGPMLKSHTRAMVMF